MQQLSLKISFMVSMLFFLGLTSRDLNTHHAMVSLNPQPQAGKALPLQLANLLYAEPPLKIKKMQ